MTVEPFACTEVLKILWIAVLFLLLSPVVDLASRLDAYSLPEVHATGSTVRLVSRVTEMSNRPTISREDGHYVNIVQVGNAQMVFATRSRSLLCITRLRLISLFDHLVLVPTLPAARYDHVTQTFDVVASQEYVTLTKCQPCHSRLVPLWVSTLHSVCGNFDP